MYNLTSHKVDRDDLELESGGHEPVKFKPTVRIKYKGSEDSFDTPAHTKRVVEMIHWLLDQNYIFSWQSPGINCFNFFFKDDEAAIHFLLSHQ